MSAQKSSCRKFKNGVNTNASISSSKIKMYKTRNPGVNNRCRFFFIPSPSSKLTKPAFSDIAMNNIPVNEWLLVN